MERFKRIVTRITLLVCLLVILQVLVVSSAQGATNTSYVTYLYTNVLNRSPAAGEVSAWVSAIDSGALNRTQVARAIVTSHELHVLNATAVYAYVLGRSGSVGEINAWVNAMDSGLSYITFATLIVGSEEYYNHYGLNTVTYVDTLYDEFLYRAPSGAEETPWINAINSGGLTRTDAAMRFSMCHEFHTNLVTSSYSGLLGRSGSVGEIDVWASAMDAGMAFEDVRASFLGCDEFYNHIP